MKTKITLITLIFASLFTFTDAQAQRCGIVNTAFAPGERIEYDISFRMGIVRARAGRAIFTIEESTLHGQPVYKAQMTLGTTGAVNVLHSYHETTTAFMDKNNLRPLLTTRETQERSPLTESHTFSYNGDQVTVRAVRHINDALRFDEVLVVDECTFDNFSILLFVRNLDYSQMNVGDRKRVRFINGRRLIDMYVNFLGISTVRVGGERHEVINISMTIFDEAFSNPTEAISASLTNDANRIPIIINTDLRVGAVRLEMRNVSGVRN